MSSQSLPQTTAKAVLPAITKAEKKKHTTTHTSTGYEIYHHRHDEIKDICTLYTAFHAVTEKLFHTFLLYFLISIFRVLLACLT